MGTMANGTTSKSGRGTAATVRFARATATAVVAFAMPLPAAEHPAPGEGVDQDVDQGVHKELANETRNPYSDLSDEKLGALAGRFEELDLDQRRSFLTEVRKRMTARGERPRIPVGENDRFGRVSRKVEYPARTIRRDVIDTVAPAPHRPVNDDAAKVFGTGFELRRQRDAEAATPAPKSKDPSRSPE